jgi:hypothetical protein
VEVLSSTGYLDSSGYYLIVGEVQNKGDRAVNFVRVKATYHDSQGFTIDSRFDLTILYTILPGRKSPFTISLLDTSESAVVSSYILGVTYLQTNDLPLKLEILSITNYVNAAGELNIIGDLKNLGEEALANAKVAATYYDNSSRVIAVTQTGFDPDIIGEFSPNRTIEFEIVLDKSRAQYVHTYALAAESNQYAMIPEFSSSMLLLILAVTSFVFSLGKVKSKPKTT